MYFSGSPYTPYFLIKRHELTTPHWLVDVFLYRKKLPKTIRFREFSTKIGK